MYLIKLIALTNFMYKPHKIYNSFFVCENKEKLLNQLSFCYDEQFIKSNRKFFFRRKSFTTRQCKSNKNVWINTHSFLLIHCGCCEERKELGRSRAWVNWKLSAEPKLNLASHIRPWPSPSFAVSGLNEWFNYSWVKKFSNYFSGSFSWFDSFSLYPTERIKSLIYLEKGR